MSKPFAKSKACAAKTMYAIMKEMQRRGGSIPSNEISSFVEKNVPLTDWEKERAGKMQYFRWAASTHFYSIDYKAAGLILKKGGVWYLTPEGEASLSSGPEAIIELACNAYRRLSQEKEDHVSDNVEDIENTQKAAIMKLEELEEKASEDINEFIRNKGPYEFQDMVAALLRAMGYYTPFVAPKGKDGGIDIIAYVDPLGAQTPRIKVQVKHRPDAAISSSNIRDLLGVLKAGDIALFVTSGTFSQDARNTALNGKEYIRIIDGEEFIDMWQQYYDKMSDEDKNMLPLKRIAFLGSNE